MRALGYVRVSTDEQAESGAGLAAQREAIRAEVERRGWFLVEIVEDAGFSAKNLRRPGIQSALQRLADHDADALIVAKLDRLSRSMLDFSGLMERSQHEGWVLVALDLGVDTSSPAGEVMANVMAAFAQFERRLIGQRTREALAEKRRLGVVLGRPVCVPPEIRDRILLERSAGWSYGLIADGLNADGVARGQGGRQWWPSSVRAVALAKEH